MGSICNAVGSSEPPASLDASVRRGAGQRARGRAGRVRRQARRAARRERQARHPPAEQRPDPERGECATIVWDWLMLHLCIY